MSEEGLSEKAPKKDYTLQKKEGTFCGCKSFLVPKQVSTIDDFVRNQLFKDGGMDSDLIFYCKKCDEYSSPEGTGASFAHHEMTTKEEIAVIEDPTIGAEVVDHQCGECKNPKAYYNTQPPRYGDEDILEIWKCTACGKVERTDMDVY
jgi:DNA-directed RNA polymerase subunit M/transcription elongation factor TFIIS